MGRHSPDQPPRRQRRRASTTSDDAPGDADQPTPQQRIWQVVAQIPTGAVATYGQVAALAGMPRHARLVGRTLKHLPKGTKLPWHRVINAAGRIATRGDATDGSGENEQRRRLEQEGIEFVGERVPLSQFRWDAG